MNVTNTTIITEDTHAVEYAVQIEQDGCKVRIHLGPGMDLATGEYVPPLTPQRFAEYLDNIGTSLQQ